MKRTGANSFTIIYQHFLQRHHGTSIVDISNKFLQPLHWKNDMAIGGYKRPFFHLITLSPFTPLHHYTEKFEPKNHGQTGSKKKKNIADAKKKSFIIHRPKNGSGHTIERSPKKLTLNHKKSNTTGAPNNLYCHKKLNTVFL